MGPNRIVSLRAEGEAISSVSYYTFNFEYGSKNGKGNVTQFAVPYGADSHCNEVYYRGRYSGHWSGWRKVISEIDGKVGIGTASPKSKLHVVGIPEYTDNTAAKNAGLTSGAFYRTRDILKVVHD